MANTKTRTPALIDSRGQLLRARTFSATSIHTPKPSDPTRTLCGGKVWLASEYVCEGAAERYGCDEHAEPTAHQVDLTVCAGGNPELCGRCEKSLAVRHIVP